MEVEEIQHIRFYGRSQAAAKLAKGNKPGEILKINPHLLGYPEPGSCWGTKGFHGKGKWPGAEMVTEMVPWSLYNKSYRTWCINYSHYMLKAAVLFMHISALLSRSKWVGAHNEINKSERSGNQSLTCSRSRMLKQSFSSLPFLFFFTHESFNKNIFLSSHLGTSPTSQLQQLHSLHGRSRSLSWNFR